VVGLLLKNQNVLFWYENVKFGDYLHDHKLRETVEHGGEKEKRRAAISAGHFKMHPVFFLRHLDILGIGRLLYCFTGFSRSDRGCVGTCQFLLNSGAAVCNGTKLVHVH
jgi:hypothetical protein